MSVTASKPTAAHALTQRDKYNPDKTGQIQIKREDTVTILRETGSQVRQTIAIAPATVISASDLNSHSSQVIHHTLQQLAPPNTAAKDAEFAVKDRQMHLQSTPLKGFTTQMSSEQLHSYMTS